MKWWILANAGWMPIELHSLSLELHHVLLFATYHLRIPIAELSEKGFIEPEIAISNTRHFNLQVGEVRTRVLYWIPGVSSENNQQQPIDKNWTCSARETFQRILVKHSLALTTIQEEARKGGWGGQKREDSTWGKAGSNKSAIADFV